VLCTDASLGQSTGDDSITSNQPGLVFKKMNCIISKPSSLLIVCLAVLMCKDERLWEFQLSAGLSIS
jgi:hypothetical protein